MEELLQSYENKAAEIVFEWKDAETEAEGWVVINSLRGGAAGGGTRMRKGLNKHEVLSLAKTMEIKFTIAGPQIGGAKSGINFDPKDPRKEAVLNRWFKAVSPLLKTYYGTGGDLNVDEVHEVIPITEKYGIWHPQEGVLNGHFTPSKSDKINRIGKLRQGVSKVVENPKYSPLPEQKYLVADLITGYGVAESVKHFYSIYGGEQSEKKAIIQGWGNVGAAAAYYFTQNGGSIIGIIDREGGLIKEEGFSFDEIKSLFINKKGNQLNAENILPFDEVNAKIWNLGAEVFLPCAASRLIKEDQINQLIQSGLEIISAGANVPFADQEIFFGPIAAHADQKLSVIPDFISNCGMARVFAYLMSKEGRLNDEKIFEDTSRTIKKAIQEVFNRSSSQNNISKTAFTIALEKLL